MFLTSKNGNFICLNLILSNVLSPQFNIYLGALTDTYLRLGFSLKPQSPFSFNDSANSKISDINSNISLISNLLNKKFGIIISCWLKLTAILSLMKGDAR